MASEAVRDRRAGGDRPPPLGDFLSREEAAALLRKSPATIDSMRKSNRLRRGVHWFKPRGSQPLFSRRALETWVRGGAPEPIGVSPRAVAGCPLNEELLD